MKKIIYIFIAVNIFTLAATIYLLSEKNDIKIGYILSADVYNSFDYKIELEQELETKHNKNKAVLDSLEVNYQMTINSFEGSELTEDQVIGLKRKQKTFFELQEKFENEYTETVQESYGLIWDRINEYVQEYGKSKGFDYIFGANGDGSLMYANEASNLTEEIKIYINQKYSGQ